MKQVLIGIISILVVSLTACHRPASPEQLKADYEALQAQVNAIFTDTTLSDEQQIAQYSQLMLTTYQNHPNDSMGIDAFRAFICYNEDYALTKNLYAKASKLIRDNERIRLTIEAIDNIPTVTPGNLYKEICGTDARTGKSVCLSQYIVGDKPILLDFWASWCRPCREEIRTHLLDLHAQGKVTIVGIAVWEDSVTNTLRAMDRLGVTWPVIYTGSRQKSPSIQYGVLGIPTLFLLSPDGTIQASGHSTTELGLTPNL